MRRSKGSKAVYVFVCFVVSMPDTAERPQALVAMTFAFCNYCTLLHGALFVSFKMQVKAVIAMLSFVCAQS